MKHLLGFSAGIALAIGLAGCGKKESAPLLSNEITGTWPPAASATVTGYRFKADPSDEFSCLLPTQNRIDLGELAQRTEASAEVPREKVAELLDATFQKEQGLPAAACYEPHHVFVFRNDAGDVTHAIEICFDCTNLATLPPLAEGQWQHHDFHKLHRLCASLGLADQPAANDFRAGDERDAK